MATAGRTTKDAANTAVDMHAHGAHAHDAANDADIAVNVKVEEGTVGDAIGDSVAHDAAGGTADGAASYARNGTLGVAYRHDATSTAGDAATGAANSEANDAVSFRGRRQSRSGYCRRRGWRLGRI